MFDQSSKRPSIVIADGGRAKSDDRKRGSIRRPTATSGTTYSFQRLPAFSRRNRGDPRPFVRPLPFVRPFVRPRRSETSPFVNPFVRPIPFVKPFVRPRPFVKPFVRPRTPFVRPFVRPRRPFVIPVARASVFSRTNPFVSPVRESAPRSLPNGWAGGGIPRRLPAPPGFRG